MMIRKKQPRRIERPNNQNPFQFRLATAMHEAGKEHSNGFRAEHGLDNSYSGIHLH